VFVTCELLDVLLAREGAQVEIETVEQLGAEEVVLVVFPLLLELLSNPLLLEFSDELFLLLFDSVGPAVNFDVKVKRREILRTVRLDWSLPFLPLGIGLDLL
jgi:hypothetical protein